MKKQSFYGGTVVAVSMVHILLIALLWQKDMPVVQNVEIEFIDVDALLAPSIEPVVDELPLLEPPTPQPPKPQAPPPKPQTAPKIETKTQIQSAPMPKNMTAVQNDVADIALPVEPKITPKSEPKIEPKPEPKPEPKIEPKIEPKPEIRPEPKVETQPVPKIEPKSEIKSNAVPTPSTPSASDKTSANPVVKAEPKPAPKAGDSAERPIKATGQIPRPNYPKISEENGEEGTVVLSVLVEPSGKVASVTISKSSGYKRLDQAAEQAAKKGKFSPKGWTQYTVPVSFSLP